MARKLTEREMRQVDRWARRTELGKMLDFFQSFSTPIWIQRPVLVGSNNENEIWLQGYMPGRSVSLVLHSGAYTKFYVRDCQERVCSSRSVDVADKLSAHTLFKSRLSAATRLTPVESIISIH